MTFDSLAALNKVSADWQMSREQHPRSTPVKKFRDRKSAVTRIWKAIQPLAERAQPSEPATKAKKPAKAPKPTKETKPAKKAELAKPVSDKVEGSNKKVEVIAMMKRSKGASLAEIMEATGWQKHTVRGFVSILGSKGGFSIESTRNACTRSPGSAPQAFRQDKPPRLIRDGFSRCDVCSDEDLSDVTDPSRHLFGGGRATKPF